MSELTFEELVLTLCPEQDKTTFGKDSQCILQHYMINGMMYGLGPLRPASAHRALAA